LLVDPATCYRQRMRILLTGSSGWLGRFLAPRLRSAGHAVIGLDVAPGADTDFLGSVADRATVDRAFACGIDAVIHAGALHQPDIVRYPKEAFIDVNITGTLNLLEAAKTAGHDRFVFTSTTSLMVSQRIRDETGDAAIWLDERSVPLAPRNIYGVTKLAAEGLCRLYATEHGLACVVLRTARFFPEDDDAHRMLSGENLKANEFLHRRLTVEDAARAHIAALDLAPVLGFDIFIVSAPPPFDRAEAAELKRDAAAVIARHFPDAPELFARRGWILPGSLGRVYDAGHAERRLGFRCRTSFAEVLAALREDRALPFVHDPSYFSPKEHPLATPGQTSSIHSAAVSGAG
jgi:UDP-glucose 4-epimerase